MKRFYLFFGIGLLVLLILYFSVNFVYVTDDKSIAERLLNLRKVGDSNIGLENREKKVKELQSYYSLDRFKVFTQSSSKESAAYVSIRLSLGYPYNDYATEKEIIDRKGQIRAFIQRYLSSKNYRELDTAEKKENIKTEILYGINKMMKRPVSDIYYIEFIALPSM